MVCVDRQQVERSLTSSSVQRVAGMICGCPSVRAVRKGSICELIEDAFERILLTPEENRMLKSVRQPNNTRARE